MINPYKGDNSRLPGLGVQTNEKRKLWVFGILFILVLASFFGTKVWEAANEDPVVDPLSGTVDAAPPRTPDGRPISTYQPQSSLERRSDAEDMLRTRLSDFRTEGTLHDDDHADAGAVLDYLLDAAIYDSRMTRIPELDYRVLPEKEAAYDPTEFRGRFTSAFGQVVAVSDPIPYSGSVKEVGQLFPVLFRSADGGLFRALSTTKVERKAGDWIQAYGIFFRLHSVEVEGRAEKAYGLIVTKNLKDAFPPRTVTEIDPEWAKAIREMDYEGANNTNEDPFWLLLNYVENLGLKGYRAAKAEGRITTEDLGDLGKPLARSPELYRFKVVALDGRVVQTYRDYLQEDNPGKIRMVASAMLYQPTKYLVRIVSPRPWSDYGFAPQDDFVSVEGFFYKRWQYEARGGGVAREVPLLIVTDVIPYREKNGSTVKILQWIMVGVALLIVLAFLFFAFRDARSRQAFRDRVIEHGEKRKARKGADGGEEA